MKQQKLMKPKENKRREEKIERRNEQQEKIMNRSSNTNK